MAENDWWRGSVTYQIYPRSFQDDSGDGIGDIKGITRRLPHIADLGVDAVWLSPIFTSPMADMGYDVSDYKDIDPSFGTLADFDEMVAKAHELGLKVIIDQVISHSSDEHPFFQESRNHAPIQRPIGTCGPTRTPMDRRPTIGYQSLAVAHGNGIPVANSIISITFCANSPI